MNYYNWRRSTYQNFEDPTEYNHHERYCNMCDIAESKTYFIEGECICQDCKEEEEQENINSKTN